MKAVILAGGKGTRLKPYTTVFPKPLMPIDDKPILEIIIRQLKKQGFDEIFMAVGHLAELIMTFFGDGNRFGINIHYSREEEPLGTVGPLALMREHLDETFLIMNGDVLTTLNFSDLIRYHKENKAIATIALKKRDVKIDFGVVKIRGEFITEYIEKPIHEYLVSMGVYVFEPEILEHIEKGAKLDFPDLIQKLLRENKKVAGYLFEDYWLDIGRPDDYERANSEIESIHSRLGVE